MLVFQVVWFLGELIHDCRNHFGINCINHFGSVGMNPFGSDCMNHFSSDWKKHFGNDFGNKLRIGWTSSRLDWQLSGVLKMFVPGWSWVITYLLLLLLSNIIIAGCLQDHQTNSPKTGLIVYFWLWEHLSPFLSTTLLDICKFNQSVIFHTFGVITMVFNRPLPVVELILGLD